MRAKLIGLLGRLPREGRTLIETCFVGLAAGLAAVAFQAGIDALARLIYNEAHWSSAGAFALGSLAIICGAALFTGVLLNRLCPEAAGSGIPQLKLAFWKDFGHTPPHIGLVKFVAGVVGIGGGLSLGREGPSVQIGGNLGSTVAGMLGVSKQGKRSAVAAGSAAALAAAFNAPLAGVAFVLEEILEDLNSRFLGPVLVAAVIGAFTVHAILGPDPAFQLPWIEEPTWRAYLLMPVVATLAALIGVGFQQVTLSMRG
jgi:CIC family chloride channel protein